VKDGILQYDLLLSLYPWIIAREQKAIISPDVDGILCGLLMSHYFNWKVVGFYDGRDIAIKQDVDVRTCIFLDMDIFRKNIKSCGHHMVLYNKNQIPANWDNYSNCINPNNIRGFDAYNKFEEKYPFATIHFLLCALGCSGHLKIDLPKEAIAALLYVNGTFKNLLNYPENCTSWLKFLNAKNEGSPIYPLFVIFANRKMYEMFHGLEGIFEKFREIAPKNKDGSPKKKGSDRIPISDIKNGSLPEQSIIRTHKLISLLAGLTGWQYIQERWCLTGLCVPGLTKGSDDTLNGVKYAQIVSENPFSLVIRAAKTIEYTLDESNVFGGSL
jgi:hypothetical protein